MASFHGRLGKVQWDPTGTEVSIAHCVGWTCTASASIVDATGMPVTYSAGATYNVGDNVLYSANYFSSKTDSNSGNTPSAGTYWFAGLWRKKVVGFVVWSATVETLLDSAGEIPLIAAGAAEALGEDTPAKLELWMNTTGGGLDVLYGSAICTGAAAALDIDDGQKMTYEFQGVAVLAAGTADPSY